MTENPGKPTRKPAGWAKSKPDPHRKPKRAKSPRPAPEGQDSTARKPKAADAPISKRQERSERFERGRKSSTSEPPRPAPESRERGERQPPAHPSPTRPAPTRPSPSRPSAEASRKPWRADAPRAESEAPDWDERKRNEGRSRAVDAPRPGPERQRIRPPRVAVPAPDGLSPDGPAPGGETDPTERERVSKRLARAGVCSRRDAERWIAEGRVAVNGKVLDSPALTVCLTDVVVVDGVAIGEPERTRLWRYNKPAGLVTSHKDPQGRPTVFEKMPAEMPRVISVGRLDISSEGLLLLTNDGELARRLELPATGWVRRYRVRVHGEVDPAVLLRLEKGLRIEDVDYGPIKALLDRQQGSNAWLTVSLKEGKNREVRRVMEHLGWQVTRLIRVAYGPFQLGTLADGAVEEVPGRVVKEQLGEASEGEAKAKARPVKPPQAKGWKSPADLAADKRGPSKPATGKKNAHYRRTP
jgi:23S rRNA pseudouridine2605 synthase